MFNCKFYNLSCFIYISGANTQEIFRSTFDINPVATFILDESGHALGPVVKRDTFDHIAVDSEGLVADVQNSVHQLDQSTFCLVAYCDKLIA